MTETWNGLFERAEEHETSLESIRSALAERRDG